MDMAEQRRAAAGLAGWWAPCGASSPARVTQATRRAPHRTAHRMTGQNLSHSAAVDDHLLIRSTGARLGPTASTPGPLDRHTKRPAQHDQDALLCAARRCSRRWRALPGWAGRYFGPVWLVAQGSTIPPYLAVGGCAARPASRQLQLGQPAPEPNQDTGTR
jgi:hypothetical protein